ncbi:MAG TPA: flagellar M-ring protein FliF [Mizugakiibacter sp.]|nr:flagellar M-ring protein FliF [Mizugakiibacter sp.]
MSTDVASLPSKPSARLNGLSGLGALPGVRQLMLLIGIAAAVAIGISLALWMRTPDFSLLFGGLGAKDAMAVTQALNGLGELYRIGPDGHSVLIPSGDLAAVRMKLAAQGLPRGNVSLRAGAAASSGSTFGLSDFAERMRYQANLESDLDSTIASLQSVSAARVHLAMPESSAFLRDRQPASASVVVTLYAGRSLSPGQVTAIVHLVASSVPGLDARHVSVVDQSGNLLTNGSPNGVAAQADRRFRIAQMVENNYARRIVAILTPIVGARHVRAQVVANLDFPQTEKTSETYNGKKPALLSKQTSRHRELASAASGGFLGRLVISRR